jgi:glyoxylase-like metal-dependent hydrolase (beta-lactamase superfamily II)
MTPFMENCYVLKEGGEALVIDPGECTEELLAALGDVSVKMIINTHCHIDHVGGNAGVKAHTGAPLLCPEGEVPMLRAVPQQGLMFGIQVPPSPEPDQFIAGGDTVTVGGASLRVRSAPGHSPDHVVLVGDGFVIGGDVLFEGSIGRTDLPGGNMQTLLRSIQTQLLTLPDETIVYSGHGPATTIGAERATNPFLQGL